MNYIPHANYGMQDAYSIATTNDVNACDRVTETFYEQKGDSQEKEADGVKKNRTNKR